MRKSVSARCEKPDGHSRQHEYANQRILAYDMMVHRGVPKQGRKILVPKMRKWQQRLVLVAVLFGFAAGIDIPEMLFLLVVGFVVVVVSKVITNEVLAAASGRGNPSMQRKLRTSFAQQPAVHLKNLRRPSSQTLERGEGVLYLILHYETSAAKIGVTSSSAITDRIQAHSNRGWTVLATWRLPTFGDAEAVESAILAWWRNELGLPPYLTTEMMPQGGHTETVHLSELTIDTVCEKVESIIQRTNNQVVSAVCIVDLVPGIVVKVSGTLKSASQVPGGNSRSKWQRWLITDGTGHLLIEVSDRDCVPMAFLNPGRQVEVIGRVERVKNTLGLGGSRHLSRMSNPSYVLLPFKARFRTSSGVIASPRPLTQMEKSEIAEFEKNLRERRAARLLAQREARYRRRRTRW